MKENIMVIQHFSVQNFVHVFLYSYINGTKCILNHQNNNMHMISMSMKMLFWIHLFMHITMVAENCICDHLYSDHLNKTVKIFSISTYWDYRYPITRHTNVRVIVKMKPRLLILTLALHFHSTPCRHPLQNACTSMRTLVKQLH